MRQCAASSLVIACLVAISCSSCSGEPATQRCVRHEIGSMGVDNSFHLRVADDDETTLDDTDRIDLAMTLIPPATGPVTLIQRRSDGTEARWQLAVVPGSTITTRCAIASTRPASTCEATLATLPARIAGDWSVEANGNHLIEAGISLRICR